ncbi:entericidin A/B family lipoprotein [Pseudooceanicola sp. LIPI14-2-Ac024]
MTRLLILIATLGALAACETVEGAGRDMQNAGQAVEREAQQAQVDG